MKTQKTNGNHPDKQESCLTITRDVGCSTHAPRIAEAHNAESASSPSSDDWLNLDEYNALLSSYGRGTGGFTVAESATVVKWTIRTGSNSHNGASKAAAQNFERICSYIKRPAPVGAENR